MLSKGITTIVMLIFSNVFMTLAWYSNLKLQEFKWFQTLPLFSIILFSWGLAFFEYILLIPANRIGFKENGGPFTLMQLKIIQEVITLIIFVIYTLLMYRNETLRWNHFAAGVCLVLAVFFIFKK